jgi:hypothetical protein
MNSKRILRTTTLVVFIGIVTFCTVGSLVMIWAMHQSRERASCYRTESVLETCGEPSFIERKIAHYIAHVDL